ncbi:MAG: family 20 glycosylhydrolase [Pyrinomonadaceae bacterium]
MKIQVENYKQRHAGGTGVAGEGARVPVKMMNVMLRIPFLVLVVCITSIRAQNTEINVIPRPQNMSLEEHSSGFILSRKTKIVAESDIARTIASILNNALQKEYGFTLGITAKKQAENAITIAASGLGSSNPESYTLRAVPWQIWLGGGERGLFYAVQSFLQLLEPMKPKGSARIPKLDISDQPRFNYRGMHLDVARHFMPVEFVKKYIDLMSQYKFNYFHWHLTEDQGWRIEIKKYPRLTEIGSRRPETVKERNLAPYIGDATPHGGFYTQDQIRDVVAYAKARYITVIPEIELPGHASAALAAYPQFGCKADYQYKVQTTWGIFKEVYCPTDETFKFLEDVLDETIALFPESPYIHIGGDEVLKDHWKESPFVQELKKRENLKDEHEVQSYFIRRIEKYINSKGKKIIGWDEILEGGLAPNATVMSWRGMKGGIDAAKARHDVIMTPTDHAYLNFGQGDFAYEPLSYPDYLPLERVYNFDPLPKELTPDEAKYVIGGQGNLWTEYIKTPETAEYQLFPRMLALSEVLWSTPVNKNFPDFLRRLNAHLPILDRQNVNYRIPVPAGLQNRIVGREGKAVVELTPSPGTRVHYTLDGSTPDERSPQYTAPITVELRQGEVKTLKTVVVNATGRKSSVYASTLIRDSMREPVALAETKPGVTYELLVPSDDAAKEPWARKGETRSILLNQFDKTIDLKKPFAVSFDGYFKVPVDAIYEFQVDSTWDATVVLGDKAIIDDVGTAARKMRSALVPLKAGLHKISLRYNHRGGDLNFRFRWAVKGQALRQAYGGEFVH